MLVCHTGHIASLADADEKIPLKAKNSLPPKLVEAYLIEVQTLDGLSGAPAFIHGIGEINNISFPDGEHPRVFRGVKLFGVYLGSWDGQPGDTLSADRNLSRESKVPVGMGIVAPIDKVFEIIEGNEVLKKIRAREIEKHRSKGAASADADFPTPPDSAELSQRLKAIMHGAFAGSPTQLKDIPTKAGTRRGKRKV
jgi:hypothetical protein